MENAYCLFLSGSVTEGKILSEIIKEVVRAISSAGLRVRVVVCDQGNNNVKAINSLKVNKDTSFFHHEGKKIFVVYDTPHLIKCVRNNLIKHDIIFKDGGKASRQHVKTLHEIDVSSTKTRALCKLSTRHIAPNAFDKMKVKYATQVFSHSVKAAMTTAVKTNELLPEAIETGEFIGQLNDIFDCLNSKMLFDSNPLRCALSNSSEQGQMVLDKLRSASSWITHLQVENYKKIKDVIVKKLTKPPSFHGFELTLVAVLKLWDCVSAEGVSFLMTNRLTQDAIENEFSMCRQRGGFDRNPSAMKFRQSLRHRIQVALMRPPSTTNCELDDEELPVSSEAASTVDEDTHPATDTEDEADDVIEVGSSDDEPLPLDADGAEDSDVETGVSIAPPLTATVPSETSHSLESCSVEYVAGYMAKVVIDKYRCNMCKEDLKINAVLSQPNQLLILYKSYGTKEGISRLTAPSKIMVAVTETILDTFHKHFSSIMYKPSVMSVLVDLADVEIRKVNELWWDQQHPCHDHRQFIINFLVRLKIMKTVLWQSKELRMPRSRPSRYSPYEDKLKLVQNLQLMWSS